jgi:hypothetical protein
MLGKLINRSQEGGFTPAKLKSRRLSFYEKKSGGKPAFLTAIAQAF